MFGPENFRPENTGEEAEFEFDEIDRGPSTTFGYEVPPKKQTDGYETGANAKLGAAPAEYSDLGEFKRDTSSEHLFDRKEVGGLLQEFDNNIINLNGDEAGQDLEKAA
jgi:hypothetical protein